ncbi:Coq4 family protein [Novosphingobium sp. JCM 18896]|uniref:Coq4 family protein n=1 Tax=Novosphingobium sp. JCM 18896 TaxID=2989731 RepID=UPI002222BAE5|nr:Coq4 family protein [Novosphingobium sp. JCM 18896]MCW1430013.1 Coq4 family protein [Novosphingobium sp. JCM 18896]
MGSATTSSDMIAQGVAVGDGEQPFLLGDADNREGGTLLPDLLRPDMLTRSHAGGVDLFPICHPDRPKAVFRFAKAWHHFRILIKDKEQTEQIVAIVDALPWRKLSDEASAFLSTERGRAIFQAEPYLPDFLDDHAALRRTPKGSFAHAYCDFMEREGLSAAGMVEATSARDKDQRAFGDGVAWYIDRLRDFHDLVHIMTGYGRDLLGEQCVLAFTYDQRPCPGNLFLAWAGNTMMKVKMKTQAPLVRALLEARRNGKQCPRIVEQPIQELFAMPLEAVRKMFNVPEPHRYRQCHDIWRAEGIDAYAFMAKQAD